MLLSHYFLSLFAVSIPVLILAQVWLRRHAASSYLNQAQVLNFKRYKGNRRCLIQEHSRIEAFQRAGDTGYITRLVAGDYRGLSIKLFELRYERKTGGKSRLSRRTCIAVPISTDLPEFRIAPSSVEAAYKFKTFGSQPFQKNYRVTCPDKAMVHKLVQPRLIEMFLEDPGLKVEIADGLVLLTRPGSMKPSMIMPLLTRIAEIHKMADRYHRDLLMASQEPEPYFDSGAFRRLEITQSGLGPTG